MKKQAFWNGKATRIDEIKSIFYSIKYETWEGRNYLMKTKHRSTYTIDRER